MMVNPYTAEVLPEIKGRGFFQFVQQLHRNLTFGPVGKQITAACTLILIFCTQWTLFTLAKTPHMASVVVCKAKT